MFQHGELVETPDGWRVCMSLPDPYDPGLHRWRDGNRYTVPELIDPKAERKLWAAPPPAPSDDPLDRYIIVPPGA